MGYPPPMPDPHPEVEKVIQNIRKAAQKAGKKCAIFCTNGTQAAQRAAEGFDMINVITDVSALSSAISEHLAVATSAEQA